MADPGGTLVRAATALTRVLLRLYPSAFRKDVGIALVDDVRRRTGELAGSQMGVRTGLWLFRLTISLLTNAIAAWVEKFPMPGASWLDVKLAVRMLIGQPGLTLVAVFALAIGISLAIVSAAIAGVLPALKATSKGVQATIQRASSGSSGIRFGKGYSTLIVGEVAMAVWFLTLGSSILPSAVSKPGGLGIQTDQYLFAALRIPHVDQTTGVEASDRPEFARRAAVAHRELIRLLLAEPGLGPVAIASALPGMSSHASEYVQIEGLPRPAGSPAPAHLVSVARVDVGYFDALDQPILNGRNFSAADLGGDRSAVVVNKGFVDRVLGGRHPIGQRLRYWYTDKEPGPWSFEIVGVVGPLGMSAMNPDVDQGMYHVVAPGELHPVRFAVRVGSDPERFTPRLRSIVTAIDPGALIQAPMALDKVPNPEQRILVWSTYLIALLAGIAVVLSAACLYALMSFTVAERTREIGIRTALGARPSGIVSEIARRAFLQLFVGVLMGSLGAAMLGAYAGRDLNAGVLRTAHWPLTVGLIALFVMLVGMLACVKPTLRAIRIRPMEALRS